MNIFLIGGTGLVGICLLRYLLPDHAITVLTRNGQHAEALESMNSVRFFMN
ncbi:MAG: hypothetical protein KFF73_11270 [Cyclobacteriaceae bacterium]|nr:hypothetical protein [Cyclobacteriaceae bacterium]